MMEIILLHSQAMDLAEKALIERARGNPKAATQLLLKALENEKMAAKLAVEEHVPEPTRSILLKSAAHLSIDVGKLRQAEQLLATALAGDPPTEIADEIRGLFEEVGFHKHLELRGVQLQNNELQMVMVGDSVAPGMVASDQFVKRVETLQSLIYRTSESDLGVEYREQGNPKQEIEKPLQMYVSVPRAASFAVSLKVASKMGQAEFSYSQSSIVVDHLLDRLGLFERTEFEALNKQIPQREYFDNFVRLATELAPDGKLVKMVGFTAVRNDKEKHVEMRRAPKAEPQTAPFVASNVPRAFTGRLFYFNENNEGKLTLKLRTGDGSEYRLKANTELLAKASHYVGRVPGVKVIGVQATRATIEFEEIKSIRARQASKKSKKKIR